MNIPALSLIVFLFFSSFLQADSNYTKICSFNIAELGASRENKDHRAIADLIDDFDIIVIEELQDIGGENHIKAIVDSMNVNRLEKYSYFIIPGAGMGYPDIEGYAFIYRKPIELDKTYSPAYGLKATQVKYGRVPGWAYFKTGNFDFMLACVHLHASNLDKRKAETADLLSWLKEFAERPSTQERDLIIVGDMNRFYGYDDYVINTRQTDFHQLLDDQSLNEKYRLIFCEYLTTMDVKESPDDAGSTSVSNRNNMIYDQVYISAGVFNEFGDKKGTLKENIGILDFDNNEPYNSMNTEAIKDLISDHRPIYAKFRNDLEDDDGQNPISVNNDRLMEFKLFNNYPNPFNQFTTISYYLPFYSRIELSIYNSNGQMISILKQGYEKPGINSINFKSEWLSSGNYFFTLKTDSFKESKKMLIVK